MAVVGYARAVGTTLGAEQQIAALQLSGAERVFVDRLRAGRNGFPELAACLESLGRGDVLVVTTLEALPRGVPALVSVIRSVREREAHFRELTGRYDTTRPGGASFFEWVESIGRRLA